MECWNIGVLEEWNFGMGEIGIVDWWNEIGVFIVIYIFVGKEGCLILD